MKASPRELSGVLAYSLDFCPRLLKHRCDAAFLWLAIGPSTLETRNSEIRMLANVICTIRAPRFDLAIRQSIAPSPWEKKIVGQHSMALGLLLSLIYLVKYCLPDCRISKIFHS